MAGLNNRMKKAEGKKNEFEGKKKGIICSEIRVNKLKNSLIDKWDFSVHVNRVQQGKEKERELKNILRNN